MANADTLRLQRRLFFVAALLFSVGLLTGIYSAAVLTGKIPSTLPRMALAAHLNALLGGLWIAAVAVSLPHVSLAANRLRQLCWLIVGANWANWFLTIVGSLLGVNGLEYTGQRANDGLALALQVAVVLPALAGALGWTYGLWRPTPFQAAAVRPESVSRRSA